MTNRGLKKAGGLFLIFIFYGVVFLLTNLIISCILFPKSINIIAGYEHNFRFNIPAKATISSNNGIIINEEKVDSLTIDLNKPFTISSCEAGNYSLSLSMMGIPVKESNLCILPDSEVVVCGNTIGIQIESEGVMVLATGYVKDKEDNLINPSEEILKSGDVIINCNNKKINDKEDLIKAVEESKESLVIGFNRGDKYIEEKINCVVSKADNKNKIGIWVRDSTQGVGTLTYYNADNYFFGALGHPITDVDTGQIIKAEKGRIYKASINKVNKGQKGSPGEILGSIRENEVIGKVEENNSCGIFGIMNNSLYNETMNIATRDKIKSGTAYIYSDVLGKGREKFEVSIESINKINRNSTKSMVIRITDKRLLEKTGGIVQGMSGSPIVQDGKLIGAVTHVFVNDPTRGYGIFIENMLEEANEIK